MKLLLLEGISGSGKTTLMHRLMDRVAADPRRPCLVMTEHQTERALEPLRSATVEQAVRQLEMVCQPILRWAAVRSRAAADPAVLIERGCFSCAVDLADGDGSAFGPLLSRLAQVDARLALLTLPTECLRDRTIDRPRTHRDARWAAYQRTLASDDDGLVRHYDQQQTRFAALADRSPLAVRRIDTGAENWDTLADELMGFWLG